MEAASKFCSIQLLHTITRIEVEHRLKNELFIELLKKNCNADELTYRSKLMGYNLELPHYLFIVHFASLDPNADPAKDLQVQIIDTLHTQIKSLGSHTQCLLTSKSDHIIAIIPLELLEKTGIGVKPLAQLLLKTLESKYKDMIITFGISSICKKIEDYRRGYEEAQKAVQLLTVRKKHSSIVSSEDLSTFSKIINPENMDQLKKFAELLLQGIRLYDEKNNNELLKTLFYYLENQGNIQNTSQDLHISIGATRYRLKRIQEISHLDLTSSKDFYEAHLALQILIFLDDIDIY